MKVLKPLNLAQFILSVYSHEKITPMKLQKLAYYSKVWTLVAKQRFIDVPFLRWQYGPVNPEIYDAYKIYGSEPIHPPAKRLALPDKQAQLLTFILDNYVSLSAFDLSAMTHREAPWQLAGNRQVITDSSIQSYYSQQSFAKNFRDLNHLRDGEFHVLQTEAWHAFTMDMTANDASEFESYPSYQEYEAVSSRAAQDVTRLIDELFGSS